MNTKIAANPLFKKRFIQTSISQSSNTCLFTLRWFSSFKPIRLLTLGTISVLLSALPGKAAEKIYFKYGPFIESLDVSSLESFAKTGKINSDLKFYFTLAKANDTTKQKVREILVQRANIKPFEVSQFFNSELGYNILERFGQYIQTPSWLNGKQSLRAGLVLAAFDSKGLTLLNFLQKLPVDVYIDVKVVLKGFRSLERVNKATNFFIQKMSSFSNVESVSGATVDFAKLPDLRQMGPLGVQEKRWVLKDANHNRQFYVLVFEPQQWRFGKTPVLILSHGLGSKPEEFAARAKHLASYGFLVALPQHPGSDTQQVQELKQGLSLAYFLTSEFIDRPRDISYVIDELERRNHAEFGGRLDLQSVGVAGHSFGGYGALAVAGATIDFEHLQKECDDRQFEYLNNSLILQCQALHLPRQAYKFRDPRVKAVFAANPVNYAIFGHKGLGKITIPVFMIGGSKDPITPPIFEQARSFPLLNSSVKYLALAEGQAHITNLADLDIWVTHALGSIQSLGLASPFLLDSYADALLLAFFQTHLAGDSAYQPYMQSAYAKYLSHNQKFKLFAISAASDNAFKEMCIRDSI